MNKLVQIFGSNARAEILKLLFGLGSIELHMREIERRTGLAIGTIQQELKHLSEMQLVVSRRDGNRLYYQANKINPLFPELHSLVIKTTGMIPMLSKVFENKAILCAFIFGSVASDEAKPESDIDLMVIGGVGLRKLTSLISEPSKQLGREINPHVFSVDEFLKRIKNKDHFVSQVLEKQKLFVIGNEHELKTMGK